MRGVKQSRFLRKSSCFPDLLPYSGDCTTSARWKLPRARPVKWPRAQILWEKMNGQCTTKRYETLCADWKMLNMDIVFTCLLSTSPSLLPSPSPISLYLSIYLSFSPSLSFSSAGPSPGSHCNQCRVTAPQPSLPAATPTQLPSNNQLHHRNQGNLSHYGSQSDHRHQSHHSLQGPRSERCMFTRQQRLQLEEEFRLNKYITKGERNRLALALGLKRKQVTTWFQNRRARERRKRRNSQQAGLDGRAYHHGDDGDDDSEGEPDAAMMVSSEYEDSDSPGGAAQWCHGYQCPGNCRNVLQCYSSIDF